MFSTQADLQPGWRTYPGSQSPSECRTTILRPITTLNCRVVIGLWEPWCFLFCVPARGTRRRDATRRTRWGGKLNFYYPLPLPCPTTADLCRPPLEPEWMGRLFTWLNYACLKWIPEQIKQQILTQSIALSHSVTRIIFTSNKLLFCQQLTSQQLCIDLFRHYGRQFMLKKSNKQAQEQ